MTVPTNNFIETLKEILVQFELPNNKVESEIVRLERLRTRLQNQGKLFIDDNDCDSSRELFTYGLEIFKERTDETD